MELKNIKVGMKVVCPKPHPLCINRPGWNPRMDRSVGEAMEVLEVDSTVAECKSSAGIYSYLPSWLEPYKAFALDSVVVCKENHRGNSLWVKDMDDTVGKKLAVVRFSDSSDRLYCKCENGYAYWYEPGWLELYKEKGNKEVKKATGENAVVDETMVYGIREIISNPAKRATTVCFNDGKIICVKAGVDVERPDIYSAVTAAIGIHFAGSNNALKNIISRKTTELKPKKKGPRKEFTIEVGDLVKLTKRGQKDALYSARLVDGKDHPLLSVRIEKNVDREMLVTEVVNENGKTIAYVNTPEKLKEFEYKIPVEFLRITRKGE